MVISTHCPECDADIEVDAEVRLSGTTIVSTFVCPNCGREVTVTE